MIETIFTIIFCLLLVSYSIILIYFRKGLEKLNNPGSANRLSVSVIIPAHNEEKTLPRLLQSLQSQHYPAELTEIILVDDRSDDQTLNLMHQYTQQQSNTKIIKIDHKLPDISPKKRAIREAVKKAQNDIIITTDADAISGKNWINGIVSTYSENTGMVLGYAPYRTDPPFDTLFHKILALEYFVMGSVTAAATGLGFPLTCNGANLSYKRKIFHDIGGFGDSIKWMSGDDDLLMHRIKQKTDFKIKYSPLKSTAVFNDPPPNIRSFIRQRIRFSSKHIAYPLKIKLFLSLIYLFYLFLAGTIISVFFAPALLPLLLASLFIKISAELLFLMPAKKILENRNLLIYYPLAFIPHIFYIVIFPVLGLIMPKRW
ncbi:MAG: glycosyltransferase [bacterium]